MRKGDYVKKQNLRRWFIIIFVISVFVILFVFLNAKTKVKVTQQMDDTITQYIKDKYKDVYNENEKHKQFEAHKVYGAEKKYNIITVYVYSVYKEFNPATFEQSAGHALPARIKLLKQKKHFKVISYTEPEEGTLYTNSVKRLFPKEYTRKVFQDTGNLSYLDHEIETKFRDWKRRLNENADEE
ncbi:hypothetical protein P9858_16650 [Niallia circulans]|jgi:hypothetical protein|uniref:hypothetical protein n=1 Tax=Niallia circulans TaxID=1397 RepID=UPI002E1BACF1|nr:hypothetical protein [Niallia circulans]